MTAPPPPRHPEARLIHRGVGRVEFFDLGPDQIVELERILAGLRAEGRPRYSFHAPVVRPDYFPYNGVCCFFLCEDEAKQELSFRVLAHTLEMARAWRADYAVCHLTFGPTDSRDPATARDLAEAACVRFAALSRKSGVPIDVEFAAYTDSFHQPDLFVEAVARHPELGVCIDIGHTYLGALRRDRPYLEDIAVLAPHARSMHLWNTTGPECHAKHHHVPLHPAQHSRDGWIDVPATLEAVLGYNPDVHLVCEYPVESVTPSIQEGYDWIESLAAALRRGTPRRNPAAALSSDKEAEPTGERSP